MSDNVAEDAWAPLAERFVDRHYGCYEAVSVRTSSMNISDSTWSLRLSAWLTSLAGPGTRAFRSHAGNEVTIVDPSPTTLERAARRLTEEDERIRRGRERGSRQARMERRQPRRYREPSA